MKIGPAIFGGAAAHRVVPSSCQNISNRLRRFLLCRSGDMGVGVQGEACGEVTQHTADGLDIHSVLQCDGCEGVAEVVKSDLRDASPFEDAPEHIVDAVRRDGANLGRGEYVLVMGLGFLLFQDFYRLL